MIIFFHSLHSLFYFPPSPGKCNSIQCSFIEITPRKARLELALKTFSFPFFLYDIIINFNLNGKTFFSFFPMHFILLNWCFMLAFLRSLWRFRGSKRREEEKVKLEVRLLFKLNKLCLSSFDYRFLLRKISLLRSLSALLTTVVVHEITIF